VINVEHFGEFDSESFHPKITKGIEIAAEAQEDYVFIKNKPVGSSFILGLF
jgi:hypothetical protein